MGAERKMWEIFYLYQGAVTLLMKSIGDFILGQSALLFPEFII